MRSPLEPALEEIIAPKLAEFPEEHLKPYVSALRNMIQDRAVAIVAYGSILSEVTRAPTSTPDFYVVVQSYRIFHRSIGPVRSLAHSIMNRILPPNIYHFPVEGKIAKYSVISEKDLIATTSPCARDIYQMGRFSKRIATVWAATQNAEETIRRCHASAMRSVAHRVYFAISPRFSLDDFIRLALGLSYRSEFRVEAEDKVTRLLTAEEEYYRSAYSAVLQEMTQSPWNVRPLSDAEYTRPQRLFFDAWGRFSLWRFIRRSRLRAKLRWPKGIITVPNWLDYLLAKVERTHGIKIEMTEREKKHPLIYGWKYFFLLRRRGALK